MAPEDVDLESCWQDIRRPFPSFIKGSKADSKLKESLEAAYKRSNERLSEKLQKHGGKTLTPELLAEIVSTGIALFMEEWHDGLRRQNLSGLVGIILEGQDLTASEMGDFVRAIPYSLLERICKSAVSSATGIHGLMAIEFARRNRSIRHYNIVQNGDRAYVEFTDLSDRTVSFYLDEDFELNEPV